MIFTYLKQPLNKYTFHAPKTKAWVEQQCEGQVTLNLFGGPTRLIGCMEVSNDLCVELGTTYHMDALDLVKQLIIEKKRFNRIVLDPPYAYRKSMECYKGNSIASRFKQLLDLIPEILMEDGRVITFGYHSSAMSKKRGFQIREICLISHGGAQHDTIATVEERINKVLVFNMSDVK
jgi:hypothetical protein